MATHPGSCPLPEPEGWTPAAVEAVRHASAKKDQGLLVVLPVKSSLMSVCPCAASGAASAALAPVAAPPAAHGQPPTSAHFPGSPPRHPASTTPAACRTTTRTPAV